MRENRRAHRRSNWVFAVGVAALASAGCAAGGDDTTGTTSSQGGSGQGPTTSTFGAGGSGEGGFAGCAKFTEEANTAPAAMLIVLDKSASMSTSQKWGTAQLSIVAAIDNDQFNSMSLGLVTFPATYTPPPDCLCEAACGGPCDAFCLQFFGQGVSCGTSALPQVALAPAGTEKSNQGGVRKSIYDYLVANAPLNNQDDGSPIYDALVSGYSALKLYNIDKRILVLVTDGGFSCTSVASPARPGYTDLNGCQDWEYPDSVNALIKQAHDDPTKPINTFVVGLPGSDSTGAKQGNYDTAPYHMRRALSGYAAVGSPETVDPTCDTPDANFQVGGGDPAVPCHIDLTQGTFDADKLASAIAQIRGKALGCIYELPDPPPGETIDPGLVNVTITTNGAAEDLKQRADGSDTCETDGCWDYTTDGKIELIGKACEDVVAAASSKVDIVVGCTTVVK
ncbi:MAG TPA: hypothetical protein VL400_16920 [Polyangiaceae bacterium]|jgi:hypothetical protein|nr:hypothetical protein [Polyangiaceae bacterium]